MKTNAFKTLSQVENYLKSKGIEKTIRFYGRILCDRPFTYKLSIGGGSYTDGKFVHVGLPESDCVGKTPEVIISYAKGATAHEVEHINSTPFDGFVGFFEEFATRYAAENVSEQLAKEVGKFFINSAEDGRIEQLSIVRYGDLVRPHLGLLRAQWWEENKIGGENELFDILFCITTMATTGYLPNGYAEHYHDREDLLSMLQAVEPKLQMFVLQPTFALATPYLWEVVSIMEPWFLPLLQKQQQEQDAMQEMMQALNDAFTEISEGFGDKDESGQGQQSGQQSGQEQSGGQQSGGQQSGQEQSGQEPSKSGQSGSSAESQKPEMHKDMAGKSDAGENSESGTDQKGGSGNATGDDASKSEESSDSKASSAQSNSSLSDQAESSSVASDAMKEAFKAFEKEVQEAERKAAKAAQAENDRVEKESRGSSIDENGVKDVCSEIAKLDSDWGEVNYKLHNERYAPVKPTSELKAKGKQLRRQFEKIFETRREAARNLRRGKLDVRSLHKLAVHDDAVFKRNAAPSNGGFAVSVLIDGSGSMGYEKYEQAMNAATIIEEAVQGLVSLRITQFDCDRNTVNHYLIRDFDDETQRVPAFAKHNESDNANMDGFSIRVATHELMNRPEVNKMLIILSDGQPAGAYNYHGKTAMEDVKAAVQSARRQNIDVFNIMFGSESARNSMLDDFVSMYERNIVACDPSEIAKELGRLVKKEVKSH